MNTQSDYKHTIKYWDNELSKLQGGLVLSKTKLNKIAFVESKLKYYRELS